MPSKQCISVVGPSLLALALARLLRERLDHPQARRHAARLDGSDIEVTAGGMCSTLRFDRERITVHCEQDLCPSVRIEARLHDLLDAEDAGDFIGRLLNGRIRATGRVRAVWDVLCVFVPRRAVDESAAAADMRGRFGRWAAALRLAFSLLAATLASLVGRPRSVPEQRTGVTVPIGRRPSKRRAVNRAS